MKYGITKLLIGKNPFIPITADEYKDIKEAYKFLFEALYLEQKIDLVTENFIEYEMTLLSYATRHMMDSSPNYMKFHDGVNNINRRIVNLLTACRLYSEHCIHHLRNIYGDNADKIEAVINQQTAEYDSNLSYRVLYALRNYVQHRGFPVQKVTYGASSTGDGDQRQLLFSVTPYIITNDLQKDNNFKKKVLDELVNLGDEIDLKPLVREYVTSIGNVHKKVREVLMADIQQWEEKIHKCFQKFRDETKGEDVIGVGIAKREEEGIDSESIYIFTDAIEYRQELEQKNRFDGSLGKCYVTSQILK